MDSIKDLIVTRSKIAVYITHSSALAPPPYFEQASEHERIRLQHLCFVSISVCLDENAWYIESVPVAFFLGVFLTRYSVLK